MSADARRQAQTSCGWQARLGLACAVRLGASRIVRSQHAGPLSLQKALYPEGPEVCHCIVLHPPGGVAGGDRLEIEVRVEPGARLLVTTPGAGKWYRSGGPQAEQHVAVQVGDAASLEWLPQENIVFDGVQARMRTTVELAEGGHFIGWEVLCLGRTASGERFTQGRLRTRTEIVQAGRRLWGDYARLDGGARLLQSAAGLAGRPVMGTLLAAGSDPERDLVAACRGVATPDGALVGVTALPGILAARYLGPSTEAARRYFVSLWRILRPARIGRDACMPRIWAT